MLHATLLVLLLGSQTAGTASAQSPELKVVVATPVYQPDGSVSVETATLSNTVPTSVHVYGRRSQCDTATTGATEPTDASFGWRLTAHTLSATASEVVVGIDWQRLWDRGQRLTNGPSGTVQLKLHPGDRIPLDHIPNPHATDACRAVGMGLEVKLARTVSPGAPNSALVPLGTVDSGIAPLDADLWLVHTQPSGTQHVQHQKVRLTERGASFSFAPMPATTSRGNVQVEIAGSFKRYRAPTGAEFLYVAMSRSLTGDAVPPGGLSGGTGTMIVLPGRDDVLSLEFPAPGAPGAPGSRGSGARGGMRSGGGGGLAPRGGGVGGPGAQISVGAVAPGAAPAIAVLGGHAFSLRLRVTPVPGM